MLRPLTACTAVWRISKESLGNSSRSDASFLFLLAHHIMGTHKGKGAGIGLKLTILSQRQPFTTNHSQGLHAHQETIIIAKYWIGLYHVLYKAMQI